MDALHAIAAFALASGLLCITPGLDTALTLRTAAVDGRSAAFRVAFGIFLGCLSWGCAVSFGLGALLAASQLAYDVLRIAGAFYMGWLGMKMIVAALRKDLAMPSAEAASRGARSWLLRGYLCNILNPKVGVFYVTFLPLFVPAHVNVTAFSLLLTVIQAGQGLLWLTLLVTLMHPFTDWIQKASVTRVLDGVAGTVLIGFGAKLLFDRR